jgi:hypothetical protein
LRGGGGGGGAIFFPGLDTELLFLGGGGGVPALGGGGGGGGGVGAIFLPLAGLSLGGADFTVLSGGVTALAEDSAVPLAAGLILFLSALLAGFSTTGFTLVFGGGGGGGGGEVLPVPGVRALPIFPAPGGVGNGGATPFLSLLGGGGATFGFWFVTVVLFTLGLIASAGVASTSSTTCEPLLATFKLANFSSALSICNANA